MTMLVYGLNLDWIVGTQYLSLTADEAHAFEEGGVLVRYALIAKRLELKTYSTYVDWLKQGGRARCMMMTKKGRRCCGVVPGIQFPHPKGLEAFPGGYCARHS